jgi:F-type H+-transporting ATPase subunit delta
MKVSELASRYAKAVYELAVDNRTQDKVFNDLRSLSEAFSKDQDIMEFLATPLVTAEQRVAVIEKAIAGNGVSKEVTDLLLLLARKDRLSVFNDIVHAFEAEADSANGVARGVVRSSIALEPNERTRLEAAVEQVLKKKVILKYTVDPSVIGGLIAQVGSYTFDDTISSHLRRMNEELKRRTV